MLECFKLRPKVGVLPLWLRGLENSVLHHMILLIKIEEFLKGQRIALELMFHKQNK